MKARLRRLQKAVLGDDVVRIEQTDGSAYCISCDDAVRSVHHFWSDSVMADHHESPRPSPPPALRAIAGARDRREAYERLVGSYLYIPIDAEVLKEEGRFEPIGLVVGTSYEPIAPEE